MFKMNSLEKSLLIKIRKGKSMITLNWKIGFYFGCLFELYFGAFPFVFINPTQFSHFMKLKSFKCKTDRNAERKREL